MAQNGRRIEALYSLKEAAARLAVAERTMRFYVKLGTVKARKIGGQWKIDPEELNRCGLPNYQVED